MRDLLERERTVISKTSVSLASPGSGLEGVEKGVGFDDPGFRSPPQLKPSAPAWTTVRQARQWAGGAVTAGRGLSVAPGRTRGAVGVGASGRLGGRGRPRLDVLMMVARWLDR